ncbi:MAG: twin-arginine translocase TatA/TatE family subunit [Acidobacteriaceae bacterium]
MGDLLQPWHLVVILVVALLIFGPSKLPGLGKGLGEGIKGFKEGIKGIGNSDDHDKPDTATKPTATEVKELK